jgi:elongation factor G
VERAAVGTAPDSPASIRNVVLVGPPGSGKTTLVESLLVSARVLTRAGRVEDGTTVTDHDEAEVRQQRSISLAVAPLVVDGVKINLLDTPGYADFVGELRAGLRAADAALFVVGSVDGVDAATSMLWEECAAVGMPRAVVVTKLDKERADFDETVAVCQRVFGDGVLPLYLPMHGDDGTPAGLIGLLTQQIYDYSTGTRVMREPEAEHVPLIENARAALIEAIIAESEDESLMDRYLAGEQLDVDTLITDLEKAVTTGAFFPVLPAASTPVAFGAPELLEGIVRGFPSPLERSLPAASTPTGKPVAPLTCDPTAPLCAEVVKTTSDPYVGRVSLVRVFSGTLRPDTPVHVSGHVAHQRVDSGHADHDVDERVGGLSSPLGKTLHTVPHAVAGDVVAVAKLTRAETGDTLSSKDNPLLVEPWTMPDPLLPIAINAHSKADEDKLAGALTRLVAEDATLRLERNPETGQLVLWCMGEAHVDVLLDRLRGRYGVAVDSVPVRVSLRETFATPGKGHGRLVKQSGGHGQYAVCDIEVEPLPVGTGFEFVDKVVGGAVPRQFIGSVEKGVRSQLERGVAAGYPVVDIRVTLVDGKAHSVDSSDMAFQTAGALALREAAGAATVALLEPIDRVTVTVSDEYVGSVMSDLSGRRGRVSGSEQVGAGRTEIHADVPQLELTRYAVELRSLSHGTATFTREFSGHEQMPAQLARKIQEESTAR